MHEWSRLADNGNTNGAKYCPGCSSRIYHFNPNDLDKIKPSTLSDTRVIKPTMHIWTSENKIGLCYTNPNNYVITYTC